MLSEKMSFLIKFLGTSNKEIASYANCSPSNFSRLKSGKRDIKNDSVTVYRFSRGVYLYSAHNSKLEHLCDVIHCTNTTEKEVVPKICEWLFQETTFTEGELSKDVSPIIFGQRVKQLMFLVKISSSKLSKKLNVDPSYISRMRNGDRIPKYNSKIISKFCKYIVSMVCEQGKLQELNKITEMELDAYSECEVTEVVKNYLYSVRFPDVMFPVKEYLDGINGQIFKYTDKMPQKDLYMYNELLNDTAIKYTGKEGLQRATLRLLANAAEEGEKELLLYSDQNMNWLCGDYKDRWLCFMWECIKKGVKITIIHNLARSANELSYALRLWFPVYLTGMVRSYYFEASHRSHFSNTMFINSGSSCVEGRCVRGMEENADYFYNTDIDRVSKIRDEFLVLLKECKPLVITDADKLEKENLERCIYGDLNIMVTDKSVKIESVENPKVKFAFDHPIICKAFTEFVKNMNKK